MEEEKRLRRQQQIHQQRLWQQEMEECAQRDMLQ
jgi:hypothetical protein